MKPYTSFREGERWRGNVILKWCALVCQLRASFPLPSIGPSSTGTPFFSVFPHIRIIRCYNDRECKPRTLSSICKLFTNALVNVRWHMKRSKSSEPGLSNATAARGLITTRTVRIHVEAYYNVISRKDLGQLQPKWKNPELKEGWHGVVSAKYEK